MVYIAALSFIASVMYFYVGYNSYKLNRNSELCRIFFAVTISMTIWSFAGGFTYLAANKYEYFFWNKISAFGWCSFEAIALHFVMALTGNRILRHWYTKLFIYTPAGIFLGMVLFLYGPNINTPPVIKYIFNIGNFTYNFSYLLTTIILIALWGIKSKSRIIKKQAYIITISSIIPFMLNLVIQYIIPLMGLPKLPYMGQIFMLIMLFGVNNSIFKYQFMSIPSYLITNELFHELNGLTFLLDSRGYVIKSNRHVIALQSCVKEEIAGRHITELISHPDFCAIMKDCEAIHESLKLQNLFLTSYDGRSIPFHITIVPLRSRTNLLLGFLIIGEDMTATEELYREIENHKITNEKLGNSEKLFRTVLENTPVPIILTSKREGSILYLNTRAEELFMENKPELIGSNVSEYFLSMEDKEYLFESMSKGNEINKKEITLKRKDGSERLGRLTMIPSIYQDEEVSLICIIDITSQRRIEEKLI
jgi:PAS domain S-box-containing protein